LMLWLKSIVQPHRLFQPLSEIRHRIFSKGKSKRVA
jgi:hypothetical protein